MGTHTKTTVDISGPLFQAAKRLAARQKTSLRALIEEGLRKVLQERKQQDSFRLRDASVKGNGLQPGVRNGHWEQIRELVYEDRGT